MKRVIAVGCSLLVACGEGTTQPQGRAQALALEGARNEAFRAAATKRGVPLELLMSLANHQGRFELPPDTEQQLDAPAADPATDSMEAPPPAELEVDPAAELADPEAPLLPEPEVDLQPDETDLGLQASLETDTVADDAEAGSDPNTPDDTLEQGDAHSGLEVFGLMYLTPEQVTRAALLTGESEQTIRTDLAANVDAAAAVLKDLAEKNGVDLSSTDVEAWGAVIAEFVGADGDTEVVSLAVSAVKDMYLDGFDVLTSDGERIAMTGIGREIAVAQQELTPGHYPAVQFIRSPNFSSRAGGRVRFVVIHDMEGTMPGAITVFRRPSRQASAHYLIRASDGKIVQMVTEANNAWHCGHGWFNRNSIGIEHEGFANRPRGGGYYNATQYGASSRLVCAIAKRYHIPIDRKHIFGHGNVPPNLSSTTLCSDARANAGACGGASRHHDPGKYWDWTSYMRLVARCVAYKPPPPKPAPPPAVKTTVKGVIYKGTNTSAVIAGATVRLGTLSVRTDASGHYAFAHIPAGTKTITASAPGYVTKSISRAVAGAVTTANIGLVATPPAGTAKLIGVVTRGSTTRVPGATVRLSNGRSTTTNASGVYTLSNLAPGTYTITATKSGIGTGTTSRAVTNGTQTWGSVRL